MKKPRWRDRFFTKMYFILLGVVFVLCMVCAITSIAVIRDYSNRQYGKASLEAAESANTTMTVLTDGMKREAVQLTMLMKQETDGRISNASFLSDTSASVLLRKNLYSYIWNLVNSNNNYASIYLYFEKPDYVISSEGKYTLREEFQDLAWYECWQNTRETEGVWLGERKIALRSSTTSVPVLTYIYPFSAYVSPNIKGAVVFNITKEAIGSLVHDSKEQGVVFADQAGTLMFTGEAEESAQIVNSLYEQEKLASGIESGYFINDSSNDMVCYTDMKNGSGWTLIYLSSMDAGERLVTQSLRMILLIIIGIFTASAVAVAVLSRRLSKPISKIREQLEQDERFYSAEPDEIRHIEKALSFLQNEEKRLSKEVVKQRKEKSQQFLFKLFTQESQRRDCSNAGFDADECDNGTLELLSMRQSITLFCSSDTTSSQMTHYHGEELEQYQRLVSQMFCDSLTSDGTMVLYIPLRRDFVLIVMKEGEWETQQMLQMETCLQNVQEEINSTFRFSYTIGVSGSWSGACNAHVSYVESREAARMKLLLGNRKIISYSQVPGSSSRLVYPTQPEQKFVNSVRIHDCEGCLEWIREFFRIVRETEGMTVDNAILAAYIFVGTAVRELNEEGYRCGLRLTETSLILDQVYYHSFDTLEDMKEFLLVHIGQILQKLQEFSEQNDNLIRRVYAYIDENYQRDIGIDEIAGSLGVSYSYIRKVFKEATSFTIPDAINKKRISRAKELLRETELSMAEIAAQIGYNTEQSFSRNFRKYENMLPSQFNRRKEAARQEEK